MYIYIYIYIYMASQLANEPSSWSCLWKLKSDT